MPPEFRDEPVLYSDDNTPANLEEAAAFGRGLQQMLRMTASREGQKEPSPSRFLPQSPLSLTTEADPPPRALSSEPPPLGVGIRVEHVHPVFTACLPGSVTQRPETVSETARANVETPHARMGSSATAKKQGQPTKHAQGVSYSMSVPTLAIAPQATPDFRVPSTFASGRLSP